MPEGWPMRLLEEQEQEGPPATGVRGNYNKHEKAEEEDTVEEDLIATCVPNLAGILISGE